jgi:hypothetical protein
VGPEAVAAAVYALGELATRPGADATLDKWLYRAIARCVESGVAKTGALALADTLAARLAVRPASAAGAALTAGAAINAARLELEAILATPNNGTRGIEALVARGMRGVAAIMAARQAANLADGGFSAPMRYADALRAVLGRGARAIEATAADDAWALRRAAVEARLAAAPDDADGAAVEALRGLATHAKWTPAHGKAAATFRATAFVSLEPVLEPWLAAPPTVCEWFLRRAAALDAVGDGAGARTMRAEGRARVGTSRPLLVGVLLCGDVERCAGLCAPKLLTKASGCFCAALNAPPPIDARMWRRAWDALARVTAAVGDDVPAAESAVTTLGDVCARASTSAASMGDTHVATAARVAAADAYQHAAVLSARRGNAAAAETWCAAAERVAPTANPVAGRAAVGITLLRCAQTTGELQIATTVLQRASSAPGAPATVWTSLANGLLRLGRGVDAAAAAATAAARLTIPPLSQTLSRFTHVPSRAATAVTIRVYRRSSPCSTMKKQGKLVMCSTRTSKLQRPVAPMPRLSLLRLSSFPGMVPWRHQYWRTWRVCSSSAACMRLVRLLQPAHLWPLLRTPWWAPSRFVHLLPARQGEALLQTMMDAPWPFELQRLRRLRAL